MPVLKNSSGMLIAICIVFNDSKRADPRVCAVTNQQNIKIGGVLPIYLPFRESSY